jgi:hypothetical protein
LKAKLDKIALKLIRYAKIFKRLLRLSKAKMIPRSMLKTLQTRSWIKSSQILRT